MAFQFLSHLKPWQKLVIAFFLGVISAFAQAPFHIFPILFITFPGFIALMDATLTSSNRCPPSFFIRLRRAIWLGWWFGFGYFLAGLWWMCAAFLVEAERYAWALPLAIMGLPAALAIFWALGSAVAVLFWRSIDQKILGFSFGLALAEFLRGTTLSGFAWNALGYAAMPIPLLMQSASLIGLWGITLVMIVVVSTPALLLRQQAKLSTVNARSYGPLFLVLFSALACAFHVGYGAWRLNAAPQLQDDMEEPVRLRLVQANIPQAEKWKPENSTAIFQTYLKLSRAAGLGAIDLLIWPESAFPFLILQQKTALQEIDALLPANTRLISGANTVTAQPDAPSAQTSKPWRFHNSVIVFDDNGHPEAIYHKRKLVPFGEYVPFHAAFKRLGISNLVPLPAGFTPGRSSNFTTFANPNLPPMSILICYEATFPTGFDTQSQSNNNSAQWLLNVTNDAWFGRLAGPYQHFHQARIRAVEQGLPLVRAANTGISAIVDSFGRIRHHIPLQKTAIIDADLPPALTQNTVFSRFQNGPFAIIMALILSGLIIRTIQIRNQSTSSKIPLRSIL